MRDAVLILSLIALSVLAALFAGPPALPPEAFGLFPSLHEAVSVAFGAFGLSSEIAALLSSWSGWAMAALIIGREPLGQRVIGHPAALLLTAGGLGWASAAITLLMVSVLRLSEEKRPEHVPQLALGILLAAVCVPQFEWLLPAVVSPLFLAAPRSMIRRAMSGFYLVILTPTIALLAFSWLVGREPTMPPASEVDTRTTEASLLWLAAPGLVIALTWPLIGRLSLITGVMVTGLLTSPLIGAPTAFLLSAQALAVLLAAKASGWVQVGMGLAMVLALWLLKGHIPGFV